jgi:diadenosine tetraphosphate (Ap4A) HIT family hydrolase
LFCAIAAETVPAMRVLDTGRVLAFRDIDPQAPTHVLVIPKEHHSDVAALAAADAGLLHEVITQAHQVAVAEGSATRATGWCSIPARRRARPCRTSTPMCSAAVPLPGPPDSQAG